MLLDAEMEEEEHEEEEIYSDEMEDDVVLVAETEEEAYAQLSSQETFDKGFNEQTLSDSVKSTYVSESEFSQDTQIQRESIDSEQLDEQNFVDQSAPLEVATHPASSHVNTPIEECVKSSSLKHRAMGISSILAVVLAGAALFMYNHYKRKQQPALLSKENWQTGTKQHQEKEEEEYSQSWQTEVDGIPSEMSSSFQWGASYTSSSKKRGADEAAVSSERRKARKINNKRESLASSSDFSPSYGSFTTYEKIHIKHGNEEDEIITPVKMIES